MQKHKDMNI